MLFSSHQLDLVERLCDRVGIVRSGSMVACGTVDELRSTGRDRLVVVAPDAPRRLGRPRCPASPVRRTTAPRTALELAPGADDQVVLRAALATGPVREFARPRPSLTDLFRHIVNAPPPHAEPTGSRERPDHDRSLRMNAVRLIARREISTRLRSKAFRHRHARARR